MESLVDVLWPIKHVPHWVSWCSFSITPSHREGCQSSAGRHFCDMGPGEELNESSCGGLGVLVDAKLDMSQPCAGLYPKNRGQQVKAGVLPLCSRESPPGALPAAPAAPGRAGPGQSTEMLRELGLLSREMARGKPRRSRRELLKERACLLSRQRVTARGAVFEAGGAGPAGRWRPGRPEHGRCRWRSPGNRAANGGGAGRARRGLNPAGPGRAALPAGLAREPLPSSTALSSSLRPQQVGGARAPPPRGGRGVGRGG